MADEIDISMVPPWLCAVVAEGLQALLVLSLPNRPASDAVDDVARRWMRAVWYAPVRWREDDDAARIEAAFVRLTLTAEVWPVPADLMKALAQRAPRAEATATPWEEPTFDGRKALRKYIRRRFGRKRELSDVEESIKAVLERVCGR